MNKGDTMQTQKRINFERTYPDVKFPLVVSVQPQQAAKLRGRIAHAVGLGNQTDGLVLVKRISAVEERIPRVNAESADFDLERLLQHLGVIAGTDIYLNWYRFDDIDAISLRELSTHWSDLWYAAADDVDIFDESCTWILSVSHAGDIAYARLPTMPAPSK